MVETSNHGTRRRFLKATTGAGTASIIGIAGCLGDDDDGNGGNGDPDNGSSEYDFEGEELHVMLNFAPLDEAHERFIIPEMEEKYNLNIVTETAATSEMLTQIRADPDNPPDIALMDVIGIQEAVRDELLEPIADHTDIVTNYGDVFDIFKHFDGQGVSWIADEVMPAINTSQWDSTPESWEEVITTSDHPLTLLPFSWSAGPAMVTLASTIATGSEFGSADHDVDAAFGWIEDNVTPNYHTTYDGTATAIQMLMSGEVDTILPTWNHLMYGLWQENAPVATINNPDPVGIAAGNGICVAEGTSNVEAAMLYVNETLSKSAQEEMLPEIGAGTVNETAELSEELHEFGVPTAEDFETMEFPNFEYIGQHWDDWTDRWQNIF